MATDPSVVAQLDADLANLNQIIDDMSKQITNNLNKSLAVTSESVKDLVDEFSKGKDIAKQLDSNIKKALQKNRELGLDQTRLQAQLDDAQAQLNRKYSKSNQLAVDKLKTSLRDIQAQQNLNEEVIEYLKNLDDANKKSVEASKNRAAAARKAKEEREKEWGLMGFMNKLGVVQLFTFSAILEATFKVGNQIAEMGKSLGVSRDAAKDLRNEMQQYAINSNDSFVTVERLAKAQAGLTEQLGIAVDFGNQERETFARLTEITGLSAGEAGKLAMFSASTGKSTKDYVSNLRVAGMEAAHANKIHISDKELLSSVSKLSAGILSKFQDNPKALAAAVIQAKKLGTSLEQIDKVGDSMLEWESSIENELQAELLTGKQLNFERARAAALTGDQATLMQEVASQAGSLADFNNMNVLAQKSLAQAFGMSRDEMAEMLMKQEAINTYGDAAGKLNKEQLDYMKEHNMTADQMLDKVENQRSTQERFNDSMIKLQEIIATLVEGPLGSFLGMISDILNGAQKIGSTLGGFTGIIAGLIPLLMRGSFIMRVFAMRGWQSAITAIFRTFAEIPFGLGIPLAAGAIAGLTTLFSSKKADDMMSEGGYGKRTLMTPKGSIKLNDQDTVIAGTNLGGGKGSSNNSDATSQVIGDKLDKHLQAIASFVQRPAVISGKDAFADSVGRSSYLGTSQTINNSYKLA
jgi:hypothetical protein